MNEKDLVLKEKWDESYSRKENFIFYPKEETVKFLNRFVRKRIGVNIFKDILDFNNKIRGLYLGCGTGAQTILMHEFGIDAYGIDISKVAIKQAKELAIFKGYQELSNKFSVYDGIQIPFEDNFFDIVISEGVLDSMYFSVARNLLKEIDRVCKNLFFLSLISGDDSFHFREYCGEEIVESEHEKGTVQSYFNFSKIKELISNVNFEIIWAHLITDESIIDKYKYGRYYLVLRKVANE